MKEGYFDVPGKTVPVERVDFLEETVVGQGRPRGDTRVSPDEGIWRELLQEKN